VRRLLILLFLAACSDKPQPVVEYPAMPDAATEVDAGEGAPAEAAVDAGPDVVTLPQGKKILDGSIFLEGATSDGNIVFMRDAHLMAWASGAAAPVEIAKDFDVGTESLTIRGRFAGVWRGEDPHKPLSVWSGAGGLQTVASQTLPGALFPRDDDAGYFAKGLDPLHVDLHVKRGASSPRVVADLDTGAFRSECRYTIAYAGSELVFGGCPDGTTTPKVATYKLDGTGLVRTLLDNAAPRLWLTNARDRALVQTTTQSMLIPVAGGTPVPVDGPIKQAVFAQGDASVAYLSGDNKIKRKATGAAPVTLLDAALAILGASADGRYLAVATKGDVPDRNTDLVLIDTTGGAPRMLATEKAAFFGFSSSHVVYLTARETTWLEGTLEIAPLAGGAAVSLSKLAERVVVGAGAVYWLELPEGEKARKLMAARYAAPSSILTVDTGLDVLTAQPMLAGKRLLVASKLGLWEYAAF
jgi:hypothetical protein